jgi:hypothetical protein
MIPQHLPRYNGRERGSAGSAYIAAFDAFIGMSKWGQPSEALGRKLYALASGAEAGSVFDLWCHEHIRPLAQRVTTAAETCVTPADHQIVLTQFRPLYDAAIQLFRDTFCAPDVQEYRAIMAELLSVCQSNVGGVVWRPLHHVLQKLQQFYSQPLPSGLLGEQEFVAQLLVMDIVPAAVSLRLQAAVDGLAQAQLPAAPGNAPANFNPRHTFAAVLTAVGQLAQQLDQAVGWGSMHFPLDSAVAGLHAVAPAVSQHSVVSATSSHLHTQDINSKAASMSTSLQHLSAGDRCQLLARAYPDALCPEHCMLHLLKVCPLAAVETDRKAKGLVQHVLTTVADQDVSGAEGVVKRAVQEFQSMIDAQLSAFAIEHNHGHSHSHEHCGRGGYEQFRPVDPGYAECGGSRARAPSPFCELCDRVGHTVDNCFVLYPDKCQNRQRLELFVPPPHLQALYEQQKAKLCQPSAAKPASGGVYPPQTAAQHHGMLHNFCIVARDLAYWDDQVVVESDVYDDAEFAADAWGLSEDAADIFAAGFNLSDSDSGPPGLMADSESDEQSATSALAPSNSPADMDSVSPAVAEPVSRVLGIDAATPFSSIAAGLGVPSCNCGSTCFLQLSVPGEGCGAPVWECVAKSSETCVSGVLASVSFDSSDVIAALRPASNVVQLRTLLGFLSFHRKQIAGFEAIAAPLTALLHGGCRQWDAIAWGAEQQAAIDELTCLIMDLEGRQEGASSI